MTILGISGFGNDAAVALLRDGVIEFALEEERMTRLKYAWVFPTRAVQYALEYQGLSIEDVDCITFYFNTALDNSRAVFNSLRYFISSPLRVIDYNFVRNIGALYMRNAPKRYLAKAFPGKRIPPIRYVKHHLAHLGSTFFCSPFEEAVVAIIDGFGEHNCSSFYHCQGTHYRTLYTIDWPHSLGLIYSAVTQHLGFQPYAEEFKVMGLSAYGDTRTYEEFFSDLLILTADGRYRVNTKYINYHLTFGLTQPWLSSKAYESIGLPRAKGKPLEDTHRDIAAALQQRIETTLFHCLRHIQKETKSKRICLAGGVGLNCVANGKILQNTDFEAIFVQPAANDAGAAVGAPLFFYHTKRSPKRRYEMNHAYLGPQFSGIEIEQEILKTRLPYTQVEDAAKTAAHLLADGKFVGWFQGAMEFGPRALGNRSILADPRKASTKDRLNQTVKFREPFRPFAPSILQEYAGEYFNHLTDAPFMILADTVRKSKREEIPATVHVDGTARPQTVDKNTNPLFYRLIKEFHALTGVPVVLNTSFNVKGEPIVCTPLDAIRAFAGSGLDSLIIGNYVLQKESINDASVER